MEKLYTKLYSKYVKLKTGKDTELEQFCSDQEAKFMDYVAASDEMIEFLRSENDRLGKQVSELKSEMALLRSTKDKECIQLHTRLMEENQHYKVLSEEIERLRKLRQEGCCCQARDDKVDGGPPDMPGSSQAESYSSDVMNVKQTRKRGRQDTIVPSASEECEHALLNVLTNGSCKETEAGNAPPNYYQPGCCKRKKNNSGNDVTDFVPASCIFQDLVEWVVGMKLSVIAQNEEFCISILHPSSGYSFSLTCINNSNSEPELLYRVLSLGTFERVAPEWMRDVLMFSTSMCPIFFQRVSRVIKLNH